MAKDSGAPPFVGLVDLQASHLQLLVPPLARGTSSTATVLGDPNELVALLWAPDSAPTLHPAVAQPIWLVTGGVTLGGGVSDASGAWSTSLQIPNVPALQHLRVPLQAVGFNGAAVRASTLGSTPNRK